jgi:uncharacterized protein (DUF1499 family)
MVTGGAGRGHNFVMKILILLLLCTPVLLGAGALLLNRTPLFSPPGIAQRLGVYLTENQACTAPDHRFPELRPKPSILAPDALMQQVDAALAAMGWRTVGRTDDSRRVEVRTPLLGFVDDLEVHATSGEGVTWLSVCSHSRVGKADFGANQRHIRELLTALGLEP